MTLPIRAPRPSRSPWQWLYGAGHRLRRRWYRRRAQRLPRPVVSVGNLHWGGTGKTPVVAAIASHLRDAGRRVAILSRGYGRRDGDVRLVSDGEGPLLGPRLAGDEPVLLAGMLPGVAVVVGSDRFWAGRHALERLEHPPEIFLLDDGFSHLRLRRDLDLLTFPAADPFAGGRLPPGGRLREPLAAAARADAVLLTGVAPKAAETAGEELAQALRPYGFAGPGFGVPTAVGEPHLLITGAPVPAGTRVLAVSAIARPMVFVDAVRSLGLEIAEHLSLPDHHDYPPASIEKIFQLYHHTGAAVVVTTGKDRVKLQGHLDLPLAEIPIRAEPREAFYKWLQDRLREIETAKRRSR